MCVINHVSAGWADTGAQGQKEWSRNASSFQGRHHRTTEWSILECSLLRPVEPRLSGLPPSSRPGLEKLRFGGDHLSTPGGRSPRTAKPSCCWKIPFVHIVLRQMNLRRAVPSPTCVGPEAGSPQPALRLRTILGTPDTPIFPTCLGLCPWYGCARRCRRDGSEADTLCASRSCAPRPALEASGSASTRAGVTISPPRGASCHPHRLRRPRRPPRRGAVMFTVALTSDRPITIGRYFPMCGVRQEAVNGGVGYSATCR